MPAAQRVLNASILNATYSPSVPILPAEGWAAIESAIDPEGLPCLETLGDARIGYLVAELQLDLYPNASPSLHRLAHRFLLSNKTFQYICHKLAVDDRPVENYSKATGDALEVFIEALGETKPEVLEQWVSDTFTNPIHVVMECITLDVTVVVQTPPPKADVPNKRRKVSKDGGDGHKRPRGKATASSSKRLPGGGQAKRKRRQGKKEAPLKLDVQTAPFPTSAFAFATAL
ncbi:hypothetical protein DFH06DRAFT_1366185 [Mycena polygramma]|nr:hypothetical protein DFH06DRAFT_1366185 [Mycena polygramma]